MNAFGGQKRPIALTLALLLLTLLAGTALLGLAGHFLTAAALAGVTAMGFNFFGPSAGIRALTFVRILSRYAEKVVGHDTTLRIARDLRVDFFSRLLPLAPLGLGRHRVGDLLARLVADIENVDGLLVRAIGPLVAFAGLALVAITVTAAVSPLAGTLLALVLLASGAGVPLAVQRHAGGLEAQRAAARARLRSAVLEGLEGAGDLAAMDATAAWIERLDRQGEQVMRNERLRKSRLSLGALLHATVMAVALAAMLWVLLEGAQAGRFSAAAAGGLFFMAMAVFEACAGIGLSWQSLHAARASQRRLRDLTGQAPLVDDVAEPVVVPAPATLEFSGIGFHWPGEARPVLTDVDLALSPGERIALRGDSGAGKSSLIALALRLCDPVAGRVSYGGVDVRHFSQAQWHACIAWLPQEAPVFAGSVRENLRMGAPHADDARLWRALAQVRLEPAIRALPGGLDAWIGEHGATLSTGQARRIALARALLRDATLWLLDEPTEGLDADTARELLLDIAAAAGPRSVLMVSHDDLPAGVVQRCYRLQDGRLLADD